MARRALRHGSLAGLAAAEAKPVLEVARDTSARLTRRRVPHALVGGLAVRAHGYERHEGRVELLVPVGFRGRDAVRRGVEVVFVRPNQRTRFLDAEVLLPDSTSELPVARVEAVITLKLVSGRAQDEADVVELLKHGVPAAVVRAYLTSHAPQLLTTLEKLARRAKREL